MCNAHVMMLGQCELTIKSTSFFDTVGLYGANYATWSQNDEAAKRKKGERGGWGVYLMRKLAVSSKLMVEAL
jgi:hypothetical protein